MGNTSTVNKTAPLDDQLLCLSFQRLPELPLANPGGQQISHLYSDYIIVLGPLPPPTGGSAKNTAIIANSLEAKGADVVRLNTSATTGISHSRTWRYHVSKLKRFLANLIGISRLSAGGARRFYIVPDGGSGIIYIVIYCLFIRIFRGEIVLHHRSYGHIQQRTTAMVAIQRLVPSSALQVFLSESMADDFDTTYGITTRRYILSNAATLDFQPDPSQSIHRYNDGIITIGFLSNLTHEKGFDEVVDTFEKLSKESHIYRFLIAGTPVDIAAEERLAHLKKVIPDRLDYKGPVHGARKKAFYQECDIFLFPTHFYQEAQPNVIFEAMATGAFVVATPKGCIPAMLHEVPSTLVNEDEDLSIRLADAVRTFNLVPDKVRLHREIADRFESIQTEANLQFHKLLEIMLSPHDFGRDE